MAKVLEGYTFTVDLNDRGMRNNLRSLAREARTLKNVMRANFADLQQSTGSMAAYSQKVKDAQRAIDAYKLTIDRLKTSNADMKREQDQLSESYAKTQKDLEGNALTQEKYEKTIRSLDNRMLRNEGQIQRYRTQLASLRRTQEQAREAAQRLSTGVYNFRHIAESVTTGTHALNSSLEKSGHIFASSATHIRAVKTEYSTLKAQMKGEVAVAEQLRAKTASLQSEYRQNTATLKAQRSQYTYLQHIIAGSAHASDKQKQSLEQVSKSMETTKGRMQGLAEQISKSTEDFGRQAKQASLTADALEKVGRVANQGRFSRLNASIGQFNQHLRQSTSATREWASDMRTDVQVIGTAAAAFTAFGVKAVSTAAQIQSRFVTMRNLLETSGESASSAISKVNQAERDAAHYSVQYGYSQKAIAEQYTELVKRGYSGAQAVGSMKAMMQAARASGDDYADVVKNVSSALDAFGLRSRSVAGQMANTNRVANAMASGADRTATSFENLGVGMSYVSGLAHQVGWNVEQTSAALGELSNRGLDSTRAGTGLRKVIESLIKPTANANAELKKAGLSVDDFRDKTGKLKSVDQIFKLINQHTKDMSKGDKGVFFKSVFGSTGEVAAQDLAASAGGLKKNDDALTQLIKHIHQDEHSNYIQRLSERNMRSTQMQMKSLQMSMQLIEANVGAKMLPAVNRVATAFSKWAVSREGQASIAAFSNGVAKIATHVAGHAKDGMHFFQGFAEGAKVALAPIRLVYKAIHAISVFNGRLFGGSAMRNVGRFIGYLTGAAIVLRGIFKTVSGIAAIGKGLGTLKTWIVGDAEIKTRQRLLQELVATQKESLAIAKEQASGDGTGAGAGTTAEAMEAQGENAGNGWIAGFRNKMAGASERFKGEGWTVADKVNMGMGLAFGAFDAAKSLLGAFQAHTRKGTFENAGQSAGKLVGTGIGAALSTFVPTLAPVLIPLFSSLGGKGGKAMGDALDSSFKQASTAGPNSIAHTVDDNMKTVMNKHKSTWARIKAGWSAVNKGSFLNTVPGTGRDGNKDKSSSSKKKSPTRNEIKSLGGNHYSKQDIANVKAMNHAIKDYTSSLRTLKSAIKNNDPTHELNTMNNALKGATKQWQSTAKPIKAMGKAFKTLATFTKSMAKRDAFKSMINDIPKLARVLKDNAGKIKDGMKKITDALSAGSKKGKKGTTLTSRLKTIGNAFSTLNSKVKGLQNPLRSVANSFKNISKLTAQFKGKSNPLNGIAAGLDKLKKALDSDRKKIDQNLDKFERQLTNKNFISNLKSMASSLKTVGSSFKTLGKSTSTAVDGLKKIASFAGRKDPFKTLEKSVDVLSSAIGGGSSKKGKKGSSGLVSKINSLKTAISNLSSGRGNPFSKLVNDFQSVSKVLSGGKKGSGLAAQFDKLGKSITGLTKGSKGKSNSLSTLSSDFDKLSKSIGGGKGRNSKAGLASEMNSLNSAISKMSGKHNNVLGKLKTDFQDLSKALAGGGGKKGDTSLATQFKDLGKAINSISSGKKSSLTSLANSFNKLSSALGGKGKNKASLATQLDSVNAAMKKFASGKSNSFDRLAKSIHTLYDSLRRYPFGMQLEKQADLAEHAMSGRNFATLFVRATRQMTSALRSFDASFRSTWKRLWSSLPSPVANSMKKVTASFVTASKKLQTVEKSFSGSFMSAWKRFISNVQSTFRNGMNRLPGYATTAMRNVVSRLNRGIGGVNSVISQFGGSKKLATIRYANGTQGGHPGGHMMVNDSSRPHWKELVKFPKMPWVVFPQRNTLVPNAPKGTQVIDGDTTYDIMRNHHIYHYDEGTMDPDKALKLMDEVDKNPLKVLKRAFYAKTNFSGAPIVSSLGSAMANAFLVAIKDPFKKVIDEFGAALANPGGAGVTRWIPYIKKAAEVMHVNLTGAGLAKILSNIQHESGGNPTIVNNWDINAKLGHPSVGLVQFIPSTFMHYAVRGHTILRNGFDQLLALFNDANWFSDIAPGGGWSPSGARRFRTGGFINHEQLIHVGEGNLPEAIVPLDMSQRDNALSILSTIVAKFKGESNDMSSTGDSEMKALLTTLNDNVQTLTAMFAEYANQDQTVNTEINIDGRKVARSLSKYNRHIQTTNALRGRLGITRG